MDWIKIEIELNKSTIKNISCVKIVYKSLSPCCFPLVKANRVVSADVESSPMSDDVSLQLPASPFS